jgi:hypothetical protein
MYETRPVRFAKKVNLEKELRHLAGTAPREKSYFYSIKDAQAVLNAYNSGNYKLISRKPGQNSVTIEVQGAEGRYVNIGESVGLPNLDIPTNKFMIEGSAAPKVAPVSPTK